MSKEEIHQKMSEYSTFIDKVLRPELDEAKAASHKVKTEIQEYKELRERLDALKKETPNELESIVDLGYKSVFCRAVAKDPRKVFVHVGMGFHVEFNISEAIAFTRKRMSFLEDDFLSDKEKKVNEVKDHIASAGVILDKLERELHRP
jgi:prefoldin alpha subunit